jgi:hypothetical protein
MNTIAIVVLMIFATAGLIIFTLNREDDHNNLDD